MGISIKFSDLEKLSEEDKQSVFKLIFDAAAERKFDEYEETIDFDWESGDDLDRLVERAKKHERILNENED